EVVTETSPTLLFMPTFDQASVAIFALKGGGVYD
ncbi:MAG: hypothetical protein ACI9P7_001139, partial [Candidatus Azotimanducaceae bacterium]